MLNGGDFVQREWVATSVTNIKVSPTAASALPPDGKLTVSKGASLRAFIATEDTSYWVISDGVLDGVTLPMNVSFVYKEHWELLNPLPSDGPHLPRQGLDDKRDTAQSNTRVLPDPQSLRDVKRWGRPLKYFQTIDAFYDARVNGTAIYTIKYKDTFLDFLYVDQGSDTLVISFHPALGSRKGMKLPVFVGQNVCGKIANTLFVSDPALYYGSHINLGWFAGTDTCPFQTILPQIVTKFMQDTEATRALFFGISGGGFAAAVSAAMFPDSACVVVNPQVQIWRFGEQVVRNYLSVCFQEKAPANLEHTLKQRIVADLTEIYSKPVDTRMIYLQNASDHHVGLHATPFFENLHAENVHRVRYIEEHWGDGHVAPPAALLAKTIEDLVLDKGWGPTTEAKPTVETILFYGQSNAGAGGLESGTLTEPLHEDTLLTFATRRQLYGTEEAKANALGGIGPAFDAPNYPPLQATSMGVALAGKQSGTEDSQHRYFVFTVWFGAQPLSAFVRDTGPWRNLMTAVRRSGSELLKLGCRNAIKALVFVQGEAGPGGRDTYAAALDHLLDDLLPALRLEAGQPETPVAIIVQTNKGSQDRRSPTLVELAQWDVARTRADTVLAGPAYHAPVVDNIHQSIVGRLVLGDLLALVYDFRITRGLDFAPLHPLSARRDGRVITIEFQRPPEGEALAWDTAWVAPSKNFGFAYDSPNELSTIERVELAGPSSVVITLTPESTGSAGRISYAQGQELVEGWASGRGQLMSPTSTPSRFHGLGYFVPPFVSHYCIRFSLEVA